MLSDINKWISERNNRLMKCTYNSDVLRGTKIRVNSAVRGQGRSTLLTRLP